MPTYLLPQNGHGSNFTGSFMGGFHFLWAILVFYVKARLTFVRGACASQKTKAVKCVDILAKLAFSASLAVTINHARTPFPGSYQSQQLLPPSM